MGSAWSDQIVDAVSDAGTRTVVTGYAPVGSVADQLAALNLRGADITLHQVRRDYDTLAWPYATKGFFGLKKKIPHILRELGFAV
jgi:deoxyribodipyrimidine photo-lyase